MPTSLISPETTSLQLHDHIEYPDSGVLSKVIWKDNLCQYSLFCLAANTEISEHTSTRNATVQVVEGAGALTLNGKNSPQARSLYFYGSECSPRPGSRFKPGVCAYLVRSSII